MPTYDYQCNACGHRFEKFQSITASPIRKCPRCGKNSVKRLLGTGAGIIFKGSGFYITDYRSESYQKSARSEQGGSPETKSETKPKAGSDTASESKPESKAQPKTDSKPAAKSESSPKKKSK